MVKNFRWLVIGLSLITSITTAQTHTHHIKLLTKVATDGVWLRWAPTDFTTWKLGNKYGYIIERYTLRSDGQLDKPEPILLSPPNIKPFNRQQFEELSKSKPDAVIIQELIYNAEGNNPVNSENPLALMKQNEDMNNRFGMALMICDLSTVMAKAAGLFLIDKTAMKGSQYIYKIILNENPTKLLVEPAVALVDVNEPKPLQAFKDVVATFGNKTVTLSWPLLLHTGTYSAYSVEKSEDGKNFKPVMDLPYMPMSTADRVDEAYFVDSLSSNEVTFYYQVKGITPFGETGPPSNVVSGFGKDD